MPNLCEVCSKEPSKYKCPTCGLMSCSLGCTRSHKIYCAPKPSLTVAKESTEKKQDLPSDTPHHGQSNGPIKIENLGSSPELQKLFEEYPGLRGKLREIYRSTLEEEWQPEQMGGRKHGGEWQQKQATWTAEKGFKRGLGHVTKWRENCEDGESTGSDAEGFMKFMALGFSYTALLVRESTGPVATEFPATTEKKGSTVALNASNSRYGRSNSQPIPPRFPPPGTRLNSSRRPPSPDDAADNTAAAATPSLPSRSALRTTWRHSAGSDAFNSFLDMEDDNDDARSRPPSSSEHSRDTAASGGDSGVTFHELVDRLVALPMSKQDTKFVSIFLCLYRKFAAPSTLLNYLISRFDKTERSDLPQLTRASEQLRLLQVIAQWAAEYPGDFAYPKTRRKLVEFVDAIERNHVYMFAAKEISLHLENQVEDDDVGWPYSDGIEGEPDEPETISSLHVSNNNSPAPLLNTSFSDNILHNISSLDLSDDTPTGSSRDSGTLSNTSNMGRSGSTLTQSSVALQALEKAQQEAMTLEPAPRYFLNKVQWRQFMEIPEDDFARELTRIDWIMFTSFRPRDLVRHVSLSGPEKAKAKSLQNVNRMIQEFNHLAFFVASMVLLRDKAKHRARAMEKFMNIALKLRRQNNYNSLGAVIAGINGTPVQRLAATRELVPPSVQKEFMRLVILMGTQKSHFAYRLAWENSFGERIPFLPLHRRDLVSAEEGNKTFFGPNKDRINWKKFDVMGDVVLGIQSSQRTSYSYIQKNEEVQRLVLDAKMCDEEDLFARSTHVEPSAGAVDKSKMWGWLRA
ncbi:Rap guanine nucleotide exchange factor 5 [Talaromyces islandicus]|uniref:Rap guanine nucleotide exchange factor 5 n=1 Tax=Talaromyces islandicus TaxID=28573 RepID=A0A0U1M421_TALIS|nr:Rap guanine nucleotide exchange factor 5 [Talaromyces islandicus]